MIDSVAIGRVLTTANGAWRGSNIYVNPGYGVTCPGLFTTNGSAKALSNWLAGMIDNAKYVINDIPDYTVQVYIREKRFFKEEEILATLFSEYHALVN